MNKKTLMTLVCVLVLGMSGLAVADGNKGGFQGPSVTGGYTGPGPAVMGIMEAGKQADDTWVTLKGKILNRKGDDIYTFQDASGQGEVEIERKAWNGATVGPNDMVELLVKVDKDWGHVELEVKRVTKMQ